MEIYNAAKEMIVLVPKTDLTKLLVQQAAAQLHFSLCGNLPYRDGSTCVAAS